MWLYSIALCIVLLAGLPVWCVRMLTQRKYRAGLSERFGRVPGRLVGDGRPSVWVHAVSVGEVLTVLSLADGLRQARPDLRVVISTTTASGQRLARQRWGAESVFYFPLDFRWIVRRYIRALRPALIVLAETELWPNFLLTAAQAGVPVVVVNARISDRSYPRYRRLRGLWRSGLGRVRLFLAQTEQDAMRLREIGAPPERVRVGGNLKFDVQAASPPPLVAQLREAIGPELRVLVAGSTLEGEEELMLESLRTANDAGTATVLIVAPRHPERFEKVAALLRASRLSWTRRTQWEGTAKFERGSVLLLDSIGELASVYAVASVAFVGGSVGRGGGHNPLEPAQWGVPVVMGKSYENFRAMVEAMLKADAIEVAARGQLVAAIVRLLQDQVAATAIGARAREVVEQHRGALQRTLQALELLLDEHA